MSMTATAALAVTSDQALAIANGDAAGVYRDLSRFRISLTLEDDGWHVDFFLNQPGWAGGGPHYIIRADTGEIVWKKYHQ